MMVDLLQGDALSVLRTLPSGSVHCVVTSPPYWGLRAYGTQPQVWPNTYGACHPDEHVWQDFLQPAANGILHADGMSGDTLSGSSATRKPKLSAFCRDCSAWRGELGLEPTVQLYVAHLVTIFQEVRRVLRDDGTLWLNLGDSYFGGKGSNGNSKARRTADERGYAQSAGTVQMDTRPLDMPQDGLKPKDLIGVPWRVAFALQDAGWWLRADIIWAKKAPMPESVTDRPTRSHEHVFLLTKASRYYYDGEAVKEPAQEFRHAGKMHPRSWHTDDCPIDGGKVSPTEATPQSGRNQRDVWLLGPSPYPEAHFATFSPEIPRRAILAGTSEHGCCRTCGAPLVRVVAKGLTAHDGDTESQYEKGTTANRLALLRQAARERGEEYTSAKQTISWRFSCTCPLADPIPCTVLDPFGGSGTTAAVALALGRRAILIELNADYIDLQRARIAKVQPPLSQGVTP